MTGKLKSDKNVKIIQLQKKIESLAENNKELQGRKNIHQFRDNLETIRKCREEIQFIEQDRPFEEFVELVRPLLDSSVKNDMFTKQQKHNIYLNLFHKDKTVPTIVEREICTGCNKELIMASQESMVICPTCGMTEHMLHNNSDFIENNEVKNNPYERGPLYRKYLMQFHEGAPSPPPEVISVVHKHLSKVHIMLSTKVKPTPIAQILRQEKLQKWTPYAVRIAKLINKEQIVSLSDELINRLVLRFDKVTKAFTKTKLKNRKKIMNFEFLTKQFLYMEKRPDLAEWFSCHKTRLVLKHADSRLARCSLQLQNSDDLDWSIIRSC